MFILMIACWVIAVAGFFTGGFIFSNNHILSGFSFVVGNIAMGSALILAYQEGGSDESFSEIKTR